MARQILLADKERHVVRKYRQGESIDSIAKYFHVSTTPIVRILRSHSVSIRSNSEAVKIANKRNRLELDKQFFDKQNQVSAYWAGFIAADGSINSEDILSICLSARDHHHLELLLFDLKSGSKVGISNRTESYISITSNELCRSLRGLYNIVPNKTHLYSFPQQLDNNLVPHFLRGYFDGDGCLKINDTSSGRVLRLEFLGTYDFLSAVKRILIKDCFVSSVKIRQLSGTYSLQWAGKQVVRILNYLYNDDCYRFLHRKTLRYKDNKILGAKCTG
jgi:intein-encoded DNA endonuclease-like protein